MSCLCRNFQVGGSCRAVCRLRENRELSVTLKYCRLYFVKVKISKLSAKQHEFREVELGFFQIFSVNLALVHQYRRCSVYKFSCFRKLVSQACYQHGHCTVDDKCDERFPWCFKFGRKLRGYGANRDTAYIVEKVKLRHLFVPDCLRDNKQCYDRKKRC